MTETTTGNPNLKRIRIGSYNIANGRDVKHDMSVIAKDIKNMRLDVVGIQEVDRFATRSNYIDTMKLLAEYTGYEYYTYTKAVNIGGDESKYGTKGEYGTGILSRYPISDFTSVMLDSGTYEQRAAGIVTINVDGNSFTFINTHLSYESLEMRTVQFRQIAALCRQKKPFVLTADFNTADLNEYSVIEGADTTQHHKLLPTFPGNNSAIDNIVFSSSFRYLASGTYSVSHSDHILLWTDLEWDVSKNT